MNYCKVRNLRLAIKHYEDITRYVIYKKMPPDTVIKQITNKTVEDFIVYCKNSLAQNDVTIDANLRALRAILYYFMKLGYMKEFKISEIKVDKEIIETYTDAEVSILLEKRI